MNTLKPDPRIQFFDHHAPSWDSYGPPAQQTLARLEKLLPTLNLQPGQQVLEVGCGTGQVTAWLAKTVAPGRVTALDFSPRMLDHARARGVDADFLCADVCRDDLGAECFDVAFCMHVAPHFSDHRAALRRLAKSLKPNGRIIILHLIGRDRVNAVHSDAGGPVAHDHLPDLPHWNTLLAQTPLRLTQSIDDENLFLLIAARQS